MATDLELLKAWRAGSRAAGDRLIDRYFEPLCRFFRSKLGRDLSEVEDLIQRTLLDCSASLDRIEGSSFRAYMFAVARNRLYDHLRAEHRRPVEELRTLSLAALDTSPSQQVARAEVRALVVEALRQLPLDFQMTLELRYWEQLADDEIAVALSISPHTVRSRLSRGRALLREALDRLADSPAVAESTCSEFFGNRET